MAENLPPLSSIKDPATRAALTALYKKSGGSSSPERFVSIKEVQEAIENASASTSSSKSALSVAFQQTLDKFLSTKVAKLLNERVKAIEMPEWFQDKFGAAIKVEQTERQAETEALAEQITTAVTNIGGNIALLQEDLIATSNQSGANASAITSLQTTVSGVNSTAQNALTLAQDVDGQISGAWSVKFDLNGYVTGAGLSIEGKGGTYTSAFAVKADRFALMNPAGSDVVPFYADLYGTWINANLFVNGSINGNKIIANTITANEIDSRGLSIKDASGNVILAAGTPLKAENMAASASNYVRGFRSWTMSGSLNIVPAYEAEDNNCLVIPAGQNFINASSPKIELNTGWTYTVSFYARGDTAGRTLYVDLFPDTLPKSSVTITTGWKWYSFQWSSSSGDMASCQLRFFADGGAGAIYITNPKLELGNSRTSWSPNAADVSNASIAAGGNQLTDCCLTNSTVGWGTYNATENPGVAFGTISPGSNGAPTPYYAVLAAWNGTADSVYRSSINTYAKQMISVSPGQRVEAQAMVEIFRGKARLEIGFTDENDANGSYSLVSGGVSEVFGDTSWGKTQADFKKLWGFAVCPAGKSKCFIEIRVARTSSLGDTQLNVSMPYLGYASAYQVDATPWHPGTVSSTRTLGYTGSLDANTTYVDSNGAIQGVSSGAGTSVDNSRTVIGQNLIPNSNQTLLTAALGYNPNSATIPVFDLVKNTSLSSALRFSGNVNNVAVNQNGWCAGGDYALAVDVNPTGSFSNETRIPVTQGVKYCFSAYINCHRCYAEVRVVFYDQNGSYISETGWTGALTTSNKQSQQGTDVSGYIRQELMFYPPAGAVTCFPVVRKYNTLSVHTDSWLIFVMPQFEAINSNQLSASPYSSGPAFGKMSALDMIRASNASTYIESAAIGSALIGDLAVKNAHIDNLTIGTEKVGAGSISARADFSAGSMISTSVAMTDYQLYPTANTYTIPTTSTTAQAVKVLVIFEGTYFNANNTDDERYAIKPFVNKNGSFAWSPATYTSGGWFGTTTPYYIQGLAQDRNESFTGGSQNGDTKTHHAVIDAVEGDVLSISALLSTATASSVNSYYKARFSIIVFRR